MNKKLLPTCLYETSFHLPQECSEEELRNFLREHSDKMPTLETGVLLRSGPSDIEGHVHYQVQYLFESEDAAKNYIKSPEISGPVRQAFSDKYGDVAKERTRYINGVQL